MQILNKAQLQETLNIDGFTSNILMKGLKVDKLNDLYQRTYNEDPEAFIDRVLEALNIKIEVDESYLKRIPKEGAFITISNHPFGGLDGIVLLKLLLKARPDFKVMANYFLSNISPLNTKIIEINPFANTKLKSNVNGLKSFFRHIEKGNPVGVFPAGEVSTLHNSYKQVEDKNWSEATIKLIQKANVPIIPIHFKGANSALFHFAGKIHPMLRTLRLPQELLNKKDTTCTVSVGKAIAKDELEGFESTLELGRYLRSRTYALESDDAALQSSSKRAYRLKFKQKVVEAIHPKILLDERVELIRKELRILERGNFELYCASSEDIPFFLREIGRLREVTFRKIGEGTNRSIDLDAYDLYYKHLFIWDKTEQKLVGAYRIGEGDTIMKKYGVKGFYTSSLFKYEARFNYYMRKSLELGRSFVTEEYQRKPQTLFILWQGILLHMLKNNGKYRYLIGPVSISNTYSNASKELIVQYIKNYHYDYRLSKLVYPKRRFEFSLRKFDTELLVRSMKNNLEKLDGMIDDLDPIHFKIPILLKKYIKQNAVILEFNRDPKFSNALDGLIFLDINKVPKKTLSNLLKDGKVKENMPVPSPQSN